MRKLVISIILCAALVVVVFPAAATAGPDLFSGDTRIYGGSPVVLQPNVLIIIDDSGSMADTVPGGGSIYNNATTYAPTFNCTNSAGLDGSSCDTNTVYDTNYTYVESPVTSLPTCTFSVSAQNDTVVNYGSLLQQFGTISQGKLNISHGVASCCYQSITITTGGRHGTSHTYPNGECSTAVYDLGNYINWLYDGSNANIAKIDIAKSVVADLVQSTSGVRFGLMTYYYPGGGSIGDGGTFLNSVPMTGLPAYTTTIQNMSTIFSGSYTNQQALADTVQTLTPQGDTPLGETLMEALRYFQGGAPAFGATIGTTLATGGTGTS